MNAIERLTKLVPPPLHPFDATDDEHFDSVEAMLGLRLPTDFKQTTRLYGTGCWQEFWYLLNPNTPNPYLNFIVQSQCLQPKAWSALDSERMIRDQVRAEYPHRIFPEPGGILPWATTDNGGRFFWLTAGSPNQWPTIYYADRAPDFHVYNMTSAELLYGAVSGDVPIFAGAFGSNYEYGCFDAFVSKKY